MSTQPISTNKKNVNTLLDNLKRKIKNFAVLDKQGQVVGKLRDLILDSHRQLNVVVSRLSVDQSDRQEFLDKYRDVLLPSRLISKIDTVTKSVFLDIDKLLTEYMPEYSKPDLTNTNNNLEKSSNAADASFQYHDDIEIEREDIEKVAQEEIIRLLGERLIVDRTKRKVGDVIVRKQIETRMVQIPVRYEKLVVEQVSPEHKQLAEIELGKGHISGIELTTGERPEVGIYDGFDGSLTVSGEFNSPKIASLLLNAIALERNHACKKVRVTIAVEDEEHQKKYQEWFERTSISKKPKLEKEKI